MINNIIREDIARIAEGTDLLWDEFRNCTVLVSGGNGFLASYIVRTLMYLNEWEYNVQIIIIVRDAGKAHDVYSDLAGSDKLQYIVQDVCEPVHTDARIDYIIHAASLASPKYYGLDPVGTLGPNVIGTHNLLTLAREKNVKGFLFLSSGEVYGEVDPSRIPTKETDYGYIDPTNVRSCYQESKRMGETMCVSWYHQYGVPVKIVRPFHTYGPSMSLTDGRVFADFVADIVHDHDIVMKSDGSAVRAFCYIADAVAGFFTVLLKGQNGQAYNIGNENGRISILDLAKVLVGLFPLKELKIVEDNSTPQTGYLKSNISVNCPDTGKARVLGWSPHTGIEQGFRRTIESFDLLNTQGDSSDAYERSESEL